MEFLATVAVIFGIVTTVIWLVIGWRAMRAHERIADTAAEWMIQKRSDRMASRPKAVPPQAKNQSPLLPPRPRKAGQGDNARDESGDEAHG